MYGKRRTLMIGGLAALLLLVAGGGLFLGIRSARKNRGTEVVTTPQNDKRDNVLSLAKSYIDQGEFDRALDLLNGLLIENAEDEQARELLEQAVEAKKNAEAAQEAANRAELEELKRQNEQLAESLLEASRNQGNRAEAETARLRAEEERRRLEEERLRREEEQRRQEEAKRQEVARLVQQGRQELRAEKFDSAQELALAALRVSPDSQDAQKLRDDVLQARREAESAAEKKAREERAARLAGLLSQAQSALEQKNWGLARDKAREAQAVDASESEAWRIEGDSWYLANPDDSGARDQAERAYRTAVNKNPQDAQSHFRLGQISVKENRLSDALTHFGAATTAAPNEAEFWFELGKVQYRSRRYEEAQKSFGRVASLEPTYPGNAFNLGLSSLKANRREDARSAFQNSIQLRPNHAASHFELAKMELASGNSSAAVDGFTMAANLAPDKARYWRSLGAAQFGQGNLRGAQTSYERALEVEAGHGDTLHNLAIIALYTNDASKAFERALAAIKADSSQPTYYYTLGEAAEDLGMTDQAAEAYQTAANKDANYAKPRINLGVLADERGDYEKALEYLLAALRLEPQSSVVWNNLGKTYLHLEDETNSIAFFEKAVGAEPQNADFRMNLALALTEAGENAQAEEAYRAVIALDSGRGEAYDQLARLLFAAGDGEGAGAVLEELENAVPNYPGLSALRAFIN